MAKLYDKHGNIVSVSEFNRLFRQKHYCQVGKTRLSDGRMISTIWLGINFYGKKRQRFETIVFNAKKDMGEIVCKHWNTLEEAEEGHNVVVERALNGLYKRVKENV